MTGLPTQLKSLGKCYKRYAPENEGENVARISRVRDQQPGLAVILDG